MTADDVKAKLLKEIHLRGYDDHYIDRDEEREILQIAVQLGVSYADARTDMTAVCKERGYVLESTIVRELTERLAVAIGPTGRLCHDDFERLVIEGAVLADGKKSDREMRTLLVTLMEDTGHNLIKRGWFRDWYRELKKELGLS
ncbi:MAG: hypothetical protein MUF18_06310 [Fimbriiglobus sp.]|nr:hypothetical protein [Fimbriiglobus sp.]